MSNIFIGCNSCHQAMVQTETGYKCETPGCGKGSIGSSNPGFKTEFVEDEEGNVSITTTGTKPEDT